MAGADVKTSKTVQSRCDQNVDGWIPRLAPFNSDHGTRIKLSEQYSVAERVRSGYFLDWPYENAVVYTARPVRVGELWRITVMATTGGLSSLLGIPAVGLTAALPKHVPCDLHGPHAGPHDWIYWNYSLYHDKQESKLPGLPTLKDLKPGQSVGLLVTPNGQLCLFLDGQNRCDIATGLPVHKPLWGMANVQGKCYKIMSEILRAPWAMGRPGMGPSLPGDKQVLQQLKEQFQRESAEFQQKMKRVSLEEDESHGITQQQSGERPPSLRVEPPAPNERRMSTISMSDIKLSQDRLGSGAQGTVIKGTWKGMQVAIKKTLQPDPRDVRILSSLGSHSNIIRFYGVIFEDVSCLIVTELVKGGSLHDFIHRKKNVPSHQQQSYWMKDIASGMEFLHHQGIVHRDLKSGNILLGDRMTAKLCDFGTACPLHGTTAQSAVTGTYRWTAPEIFQSPNARINKKCDTYSYGMVMYELITLKLPFPDAPSDEMAMCLAVSGIRPSLPESDPMCPPFLRRLITACWDANPNARPSFQEINVTLDTEGKTEVATK